MRWAMIHAGRITGIYNNLHNVTALVRYPAMASVFSIAYLADGLSGEAQT
jgi:hypothetical protein